MCIHVQHLYTHVTKGKKPAKEWRGYQICSQATLSAAWTEGGIKAVGPPGTITTIKKPIIKPVQGVRSAMTDPSLCQTLFKGF